MSSPVFASGLRCAGLAAVAILLAACNKSPAGKDSSAASAAPADAKADSSTAVATVNGTPITRATYDMYLSNIVKANKIAEPTAEQKSQVLDSLVTMQLLAAQGEKDGVENDPDVKAQMALLKMRVLSDGESVKYIKDHQPTDAEVKVKYDEVVTSGKATEYHARHILVASQDKAQQLIKKIKAGAKFDEVAKAESSDSSKTNGGDLGWFNPNGMVPEFAEATRKLKPGEMTSEPVKSQFGWHIIKVEETREPTLDQLKQQIGNSMAQQKLINHLEDMKKTAQIDKKI
jgi:peptidyl-prolyl cis-trans isomerase C